jgi:hypothetical protein
MPNPGKIIFKVVLKNDSYKGFDKCEKAEINILREVKREEFNYSKEDIQAIK